MLDLDEIIKKAEAAPRQTADIEVIFDAGISQELDELRTEQAGLHQQIDDIEQDLAAELEFLTRDQRAGDARPAAAREKAEQAAAALTAQIDALAARVEAVQERAADYLVTFRITALHGFEWDQVTSSSAPREGHAEDAGRNWNVDEVTQIVAARSTVRVGPDGDTIPITSGQWAGIWKTLPSLGRRQFRQAIWILNEYATTAARDEAVVAARKASRGRPVETPPSPSDSESTLDASQGGNPSQSPTISTETTAA